MISRSWWLVVLLAAWLGAGAGCSRPAPPATEELPSTLRPLVGEECELTLARPDADCPGCILAEARLLKRKAHVRAVAFDQSSRRLLVLAEPPLCDDPAALRP